MHSRGSRFLKYCLNFTPVVGLAIGAAFGAAAGSLLLGMVIGIAVGLTMALRLGQSGVESPTRSRLGVLGVLLAALFILVLVVDIRD